MVAREAHNLEVVGSNPTPAIAGILTTCTVPGNTKQGKCLKYSLLSEGLVPDSILS